MWVFENLTSREAGLGVVSSCYSHTDPCLGHTGRGRRVARDAFALEQDTDGLETHLETLGLSGGSPEDSSETWRLVRSCHSVEDQMLGDSC